MKKTILIIILAACTFALEAQINLVAQDSIRLWPDTAHTPFLFGVTSGDPTDSSVIIWSAIPFDSLGSVHTLNWQLATDSTFTSIVQSGTVTISDSTAYAAKIDVQGLQPFTRYCYRFSEGAQYSDTGFTQTAPDSAVDSLSFALVSCSSLYSGYFNGYRHIARNAGINAIIHVGDWIYDFIDPQERVRIPQPEPVEPVALAEWRDRYRLYLMDPDLREARKRKPWIQMWDNHDVSKHSAKESGDCASAYFDFGPCRRPSDDTVRIWRKLAYGKLADIFIVDDWLFAGNDTFADGNKKMLPDDQYHWLISSLDSSTALWKIIAVSKLFNFWNLGPFNNIIPGGLNNSWQGYPESRDSVLYHLAADSVLNPVIISGDMHIDIESDLSTNPYDTLIYDSKTGQGGIGVEVNGISLTRGNFDESGVSQSFGPSLYAASIDSNPHQQYLNFYDNGYEVLTFNRDSLIAYMMLCPILQVTDLQTTGVVLTNRINSGHWLRPVRTSVDVSYESGPSVLSLFPNPNKGYFKLQSTGLIGSDYTITDMLGNIIAHQTIFDNQQVIHLPETASGIYALQVKGTQPLRFVVVR